MKCDIRKCRASCCYNIPFSNNELHVFKDRIVNRYSDIIPVGDRGELPVTSDNPLFNRCPFLTDDMKCNIYNDRPEICRRKGCDIKCVFMKSKENYKK